MLTIASLIQKILFPNTCLICFHGQSWLCSKCQKVVDQKAKIKKNPLLLTIPYVDKSFAVYRYQYPVVKKLIKLYKYQSIQKISPLFANWLSKLVENKINNQLPIIIIPVPLFTKREKNRGFNQAYLLAKSLSDTLKLPFNHDLTRQKNTTPQAQLSATQRWSNLENAFIWQGSISLTNYCVILVDDVITTGATVSACAQELKRHGAKSVIALAIAHG